MAPDESTAEDATEDVPVAPEGSEAADTGEEASETTPTPGVGAADDCPIA